MTDDRASWYFGGLGRVYFRDQDAHVIPVVEVNAVRSLHDRYEDQTTIQALAGLVFPIGTSGGRFRIARDDSKTIYSGRQRSPVLPMASASAGMFRCCSRQ